MIKTIIVDDEYNAREFMEKLLTRYFPDKFLILDKCENIDEAILSIEKSITPSTSPAKPLISS